MTMASIPKGTEARRPIEMATPGHSLDIPRDLGDITEAWLDTEAIHAVRRLDDRIIELHGVESARGLLLAARNQGPKEAQRPVIEATETLYQAMHNRWPDQVSDPKVIDLERITEQVRRDFTEGLTLSPDQVAERRKDGKTSLAAWRQATDEEGLAKQLAWSTNRAQFEKPVAAVTTPDDSAPEEGVSQVITLDTDTVDALEVEKGILATVAALREELNKGHNTHASILIPQAYLWLDRTQDTQTRIEHLTDKTSRINNNAARVVHPLLQAHSLQMFALELLTRDSDGVFGPAWRVDQIQADQTAVHELLQTIPGMLETSWRDEAAVMARLRAAPRNHSLPADLIDVERCVSTGTPLTFDFVEHVTRLTRARLEELSEILSPTINHESDIAGLAMGGLLGAIRAERARRNLGSSM